MTLQSCRDFYSGRGSVGDGEGCIAVGRQAEAVIVLAVIMMVGTKVDHGHKCALMGDSASADPHSG